VYKPPVYQRRSDSLRPPNGVYYLTLKCFYCESRLAYLSSIDSHICMNMNNPHKDLTGTDDLAIRLASYLEKK
jgi:hypothetical protein